MQNKPGGREGHPMQKIGKPWFFNAKGRSPEFLRNFQAAAGGEGIFREQMFTFAP